MCESERPATQVHADSAWKRRFYQNYVIFVQEVSQDFVLQGGSVCHHRWGSLLMARAGFQPFLLWLPNTRSVPAQMMELKS